MSEIVVVGGGGHARSIIDALRSEGIWDPVACTDPDGALHGGVVDGVAILGGDELLEELRARGVLSAVLGVGGVGDNTARARLFARLGELGFSRPTIVHARAHVASSARLGHGTVVLAGAVVGAGVTVGADVIVNTGAIVEHDCLVADHVHLATGCVLGGAVTVGEGAHVGLAAAVLQGRAVGEWAVVGAGAVVTRPVAAGDTVVGCPASSRRSGV